MGGGKRLKGPPQRFSWRSLKWLPPQKVLIEIQILFTNRCFRCQDVTSKTEAIKTTRTKMSWSSNDRQEVLLCDWILMGRFRLSYPRSQKLFFTKAFSVWKILNSNKSLVSHLFVAGLEKGHIKPTNSFQVRKSPEQKVLNLLKSHFYEKKI